MLHLLPAGAGPLPTGSLGYLALPHAALQGQHQTERQPTQQVRVQSPARVPQPPTLKGT